MFVSLSNLNSIVLKSNKEQKESLIKKNYNHIYSHEMAHKIAGGSMAGSISIIKNSEGIPVAGYVPILMPFLNTKNPQKTIEQSNTVIKAAMAPTDPSAQDYSVANKAKAIKNKAENIKNSKKLDILA